jgi:hypothetical protein
LQQQIGRFWNSKAYLQGTYSYEEASHKALESKSSESVTVQGSHLIDQCRTTFANTHANPYDLAAALALVTGRRMVELFSSGAFEPVEGNEQACVFFRACQERGTEC